MDLATYLDRHALRPSQFAARLGVPASTVARILGGKRRPRFDTIQKIIAATGGQVSIDSFAVAGPAVPASPSQPESEGAAA